VIVKYNPNGSSGGASAAPDDEFEPAGLGFQLLRAMPDMRKLL
jgi:hypothetical protein